MTNKITLSRELVERIVKTCPFTLLELDYQELRAALAEPVPPAFPGLQMIHVAKALESVRGKPVLTSNQCHDLAQALNDAQRAEIQPVPPAGGDSSQTKIKPVFMLRAERLWGKDGEYAVTTEDHEWLNRCRRVGGDFPVYSGEVVTRLQAEVDSLKKVAKAYIASDGERSLSEHALRAELTKAREQAYNAGYDTGFANGREKGTRDAISQLSNQSAPADDSYPPCDYCGTVPDYHPWHGSGMINGQESPHIHACNDCRGKLPAPADKCNACDGTGVDLDGALNPGGDHSDCLECGGRGSLPNKPGAAAPIAVVMPERQPGDDGVCTESHYASGWNACLDEVARLNPIKQ